MLILSIHYTFAPEDADEAERVLREVRAASQKEPGCVKFEVARSKEHPNVFALWEEYKDEAALQLHQASAHFQKVVLPRLRPLAKERIAETVYPI